MELVWAHSLDTCCCSHYFVQRITTGGIRQVGGGIRQVVGGIRQAGGGHLVPTEHPVVSVDVLKEPHSG